MIPVKLHPGDHLRVIAPSTSMAVVSPEVRAIAADHLEGLGFSISFGQHALEKDDFSSSSVVSRLADLHAAFADPSVNGILTAIGGYNANQLLAQIDYDLIRSHPKVFCGYSDITALCNAIYAKTGLVTYSGPHFSSFGMEKGLEFTLEYFRKCLMEEGPFEVRPSKDWSDDSWYHEQSNRMFYPNSGWLLLATGSAQGKLLGGNLCTLNLLQGTEYMPDLEASILLVEDDEESYPAVFDRDLQSLLHQPGFSGVRGLLVGRFQKASHMETGLLKQIVCKPELDHIPVGADLDFGHTTPIFTFPVGGSGQIEVEKGSVHFSIQDH